MIAAQKDIVGFLNNADNAQRLNDSVEDIREAVMDYQVRTSRGLDLITSNVRLRRPYNGIRTKTPVR